MKKFIGLILVCIMSFALTACGTTQNTSATSNSKVDKPSNPTIATTTDTPIEEPIVTPTDTVKPTESASVTESETSSIPTDINSYIDDGYFNLIGYLNANSLPFFYVEPAIEGGDSFIVISTTTGFHFQISSSSRSNENTVYNTYVVYEQDSMPSMGYTHEAIANPDTLLTTNYDDFYICPDDLYVLKYLVENANNLTSGSCPFARGNIPHTFNNNNSPIECND